MLLDYRSPHEKRSVGRPEAPLFDDEYKENEFLETVRLLIEQYYIKGEPGTRLDYVFGSKPMSKTMVWAIIYLYLLDNDIINNNLDRFTNIIIIKFGKQYISDRTSLHKKIKSLLHLKANRISRSDMMMKTDKYEIKASETFIFVVGKWKELEENSVSNNENISKRI